MDENHFTPSQDLEDPLFLTSWRVAFPGRAHRRKSHTAQRVDSGMHPTRARKNGNLGPQRKQAAFHELRQDITEVLENRAVAFSVLERMELCTEGNGADEVKGEEDMQGREVTRGACRRRGIELRD